MPRETNQEGTRLWAVRKTLFDALALTKYPRYRFPIDLSKAQGYPNLEYGLSSLPSTRKEKTNEHEYRYRDSFFVFGHLQYTVDNLDAYEEQSALLLHNIDWALETFDYDSGLIVESTHQDISIEYINVMEMITNINVQDNIGAVAVFGEIQSLVEWK